MSWGYYLFGFGGRINRARMWAYILVVAIVEIPLIIAGAALGSERVDALSRTPVSVALVYAAAATLAWSMLAAIVKRLHDRDKSGWWLLLFYAAPIAIFAGLSLLGVAPRNGDVPPSVTPLFVVALLVLAANNLWFLAELFLLKGTEGPNRFGPDPLHSL